MSQRFTELSRQPNEHKAGEFAIIRDDQTGQHYRVSHIESAFDTRAPETLVFTCDSSGEVTDWTDVAGGMNKSIPEAIADLETVLDGRVRTLAETPIMEFAGGDPLDAILNTLSAMATRGQKEN